MVKAFKEKLQNKKTCFREQALRGETIMNNLTQFQDYCQNLLPGHLTDLRKSGLSDATIAEASIKSVPHADIGRRLGFNISFIISAYEIPYNASFSRFKVFYDETSTGKHPKYLSRKNSGSRLYIPLQARAVLSDTSIPLYITEGEKKALKASQEGFPCIGLSGLWGWSNGGKELIPDFDSITFEGRTVYLIPDNDYLLPNRDGYEKNLNQAIYLLANKLKSRGAKVFIIELPQGAEKGLDDFLCAHPLEDFHSLPVIEVLSLSEKIAGASQNDVQDILKDISDIASETERACLIESLSKRLHIGKKAIQKDIQGIKPDAKNKKDTVLSANIPGLVDLVLDESGAVVYLIKNETTLKVILLYEVDGILYAPPEKQYLPFELSKAEEVIKLYQAGHDKNLFADVVSHLKRFSYLPDNQWLIVACKVFLSYLQDHTDIHYMPMILFYAVPERGKSRTGKAVSYLSYRGVHVVDLREANLFRFAQNLKATLFFDLMDLWKKAEKNGAEDILLLRYEKGAKATRVIYPEKGAFKDTVYYDVYGPTIIATNEPLHKILDSRGINITMPNKPGNYENPTPEKASDIKARLTAWRARVMNRPLPVIEPIEGISGRLWDISRPMFQVCKMVYPEGFNDLVIALKEVAGQRIEDKKASIEGQIVGILYELSSEGLPEWTVKTSEIISKLNENRQESHKLTSQYLGRKLKAIGLNTRKLHGYSEVKLNLSDFNILLTQHGLENISLLTLAETLPLSTTLQNQPPEPFYTGRELGESSDSLPDSLPPETLDTSQSLRLVEFGRELTGVSGKIFKVSSLELVS